MFRHETKVENAHEKLGSVVSELEAQGISSADITILSPNIFEESCVSKLRRGLKNRIKKLDESSIRNLPVSGISFAEIKNFKGLENNVIIVVDLQKPDNFKDESEKVDYYVSMSRARALLCVIWIKE